jgi:3-deoxy-manno-octulosonate cytidylyltransferase (CMP-KDO synthetase)
MPEVKEVAVAVIPARFASSRVPAKPLADIGGLPMIRRVYERATLAKSVSRVIVATDDERIREAVGCDHDVVMTRADHPSGTDRVAEVAARLDAGIVVNIQGDLPMLDPRMVDALVDALRTQPDLPMATVAVPISQAREMQSSSVVKVVTDLRGRALYFSRAPIPFCRDTPGLTDKGLHHVGLYAYRRDVLMRLASLAPSPLEESERLEQLRALENGVDIGIVKVQAAIPMEVDTLEDLEAVRKIIDGLGT